jgi:hypothetical protein
VGVLPAIFDVVVGTNKLEYLAVNQVRGMRDLSVIRQLRRLRLIKLYGLPQVSALPSFKKLTELKRAELGLMPGLKSLKPLLEAPNLRELLFSKKMNVRPADVQRIIDHFSIKRFAWFAEDVPDKVWEPIVKKIGLPEAEPLHPEEWFWRKTGGSPYPLVPQGADAAVAAALVKFALAVDADQRLPGQGTAGPV